jgi:hypothetical protein
MYLQYTIDRAFLRSVPDPLHSFFCKRCIAGASHTQSRQSAKLFLKSSELGLPQPLTRRLVWPPPPVLGGGAHSLAREGLGKSQIQRGDLHYGTLYIYELCDPIHLLY